MDLTVTVLTPAIQVQQINQTGAYQGENPGRQTAFLQGQSFQALITAMNKDGSFTMDVGGRTLTASSEIPLAVGQNLRLAVVQTSPQITLQILPNELPQQIGKNLHLLPQQQELLPLVRMLAANGAIIDSLSESTREFLTTFRQITPEGTVPDGPQLRHIVEGLGLRQEQHLSLGRTEPLQANLKSVLGEIIAAIPANDPVVEQAGKALQTLELAQLLQVRLDEMSLLFVPLPLEILEHGYLIGQQQQEDSRDGETQTERSYSLHLSLQGLGNLQVNLVQTGDKLNLQFYAEDRERAAFLAGFRDELARSLTALRLEHVSFLAGVQHPVQAILAAVSPDRTGLLDTRV